jgi:glutaredoxin
MTKKGGGKRVENDIYNLQKCDDKKILKKELK